MHIRQHWVAKDFDHQVWMFDGEPEWDGAVWQKSETCTLAVHVPDVFGERLCPGDAAPVHKFTIDGSRIISHEFAA